MTSTPVQTLENICLVDDEPAVLTSLTRLLHSEGFAVKAFSEPATFLDYAGTNSVRVAIVDIWMEHMTGLEVQAKLAKISPGTRVIIMTGRRDPAVEKTAIDYGAEAYFTKPFDDEAFLGAVRTALRANG